MGNKMLRTIRQFFMPPVFPDDEDKTNAARVLYTFLAWMLTIIGLEIIVVLLFATQKASATFGLAITAFLILASYALARRGRVRLASALFVFGVWSISTLFVLFIGRLPISFASIQVAIAIIAALLLGRRPTIIVAVLSITVGLGLAILENTGASPINYFPAPPTISWFGWAFSFVLVLPALNLTLQSSTQALARARQSEARLHGIITSAMDAIITINEEQRIILANGAATKLFGYPVNELLGQPLEKLLPMRYRVDHTHHVQNFGATGVTERAMHGASQVMGLRANGQEFPMEASISQVVTETGKLYTVILRDISERKRAEEALRASEEKFKQLAENIEDVFWIRAAGTGNMIYINPAYEKIWGRSVQNLYENRQAFMESIHPDDIEKVREEYKRTTQTGRFNLDYRIVRPDGTTRSIHARSFPINDGNGNFIRIVGVATDITERKEAEEELRTLQTRAELLARTIGALLTSTNPLAKVEDICNEVREFLHCAVFFSYLLNPATQRLQFNASGGVDRRIARLPEGLELSDSLCGTAVQGNCRVLAENLTVTFDARSEVVRSLGVRAYCCHPLLGPGNVAFGTLSFGASDRDVFSEDDLTLMETVTDYVAVAMLRKQAEEALRASALTYQGLFTNLHDAILIADDQGRYLDVNPSACNQIGYTREEFLKMSIWDITPEANKEQAFELWKDFIAKGKQSGEFMVSRKDGAKLVFDYRAVANVLPGIHYSIMRDITERKQTEEALHASEAKLRAIFNVLPVGITILDKDRHIVEMNKRVEEILDLTFEQLVRGDYTKRSYLRSEGTPMPPAEFATMRVFAEQIPIHEVETGVVKENGKIIWTNVSAAPLPDGSVVAATSDITKHKQAELDLLQANKALMGLHEMLREQASRDALTGLLNRRYLYESIERELARAKRDGYPVSVMMIDIDHFKAFNDRYGHPAGDEFLIALGRLLLESIRQGDLACRYGGEEFILILPGAQMEDAVRRAGAICHAFQHLSIDFNGSRLSATVSVGIAVYPDHGENTSQLIMAADLALYQAKEAGRNCVRTARSIDL